MEPLTRNLFKKIDLRPRQVEVISMNPSLPTTETSRLNAGNIRKRPSPQPPIKQNKHTVDVPHYIIVVSSYLTINFQDAPDVDEEEYSEDGFTGP